MPGRHQIAPTRRFGLRWILGAALAILVAAATALGLAITPANAATTVTATFALTGVTTSNCDLSVGGSDVYVAPGQELDLKTSLASVNLLDGLNLGTSRITGLYGTMTIDPTTTHSMKLAVDTAGPTKINTTKANTLSTADHRYTFKVSGVDVDLLGIITPLALAPSNLSAGLSLNYSGTIHVTSAAAKCGLSGQVPSVHASVSAPGLPPINIGIPGVSAPTLSVPTLPSIPGLPGGKSTQPAGGGGGTNPGSGNGGNGNLPVAAGVVPQGNNANVYPGAGGGGFNALPLPNILGSNGGTSGLLPVPAKSGAKPATGKQNSAGRNKSIDLASKTSETGQLSVILAIIAVIALTLVAATYARLYVLRKN